MNPLVSIIMPAYRCEEFIEESVKSICDQTYREWELIIVKEKGAGSIDEAIRKISDARIRVIALETGAGLTAAFAEGLKHAKGVFVTRHDGDDISVPTRLAHQVDYLQRHRHIGMVSCLIKCVTNDPAYRRDCIFIEKIQNNYVTTEDIEKAVAGNFIPILFPTLMIRRELLNYPDAPEDAAAFDDHIRLLLHLLRAGDAAKVDKVLYYYRRHKDAYHIVNILAYEKHVKEVLAKSRIQTFLKYKTFYNEAKAIPKPPIQLNAYGSRRVLILIDALNIGGTETHVLNLVTNLMAMGIYVVVGTAGGPMEDIFKSYGIKLIKIPMKGDYISNKKLFGMLKQVKAIIDAEKIDLIHCHLFASMQIASEIYRRYKIPYIVTVHGLFYPNDVLYAACIKASAIIAVSEPVRKMLQRKLRNRTESRIEVIPNGIDMNAFKPSQRNEVEKPSDIKNILEAQEICLQLRDSVHIKELFFSKSDEKQEWNLKAVLYGHEEISLQEKDEKDSLRKIYNIPSNAPVILYCSRLAWGKTKAARALIFGCGQLAHQHKDLHVVIVGDGEDRRIVEDEAAIMNEMLRREAIHVVGAKFDLETYYRQSDVVVGTGRVALEAMSCEKPVIAVGNQGYAGLVTPDNKEQQWQMYFGDHDALEKTDALKLAQTLDSLLKAPQRMKTLGTWGRAWCKEKFCGDKLVKRIAALYESCQGGGSSDTPP